MNMKMTQATTTATGELRMHPWESAGLGKAPFVCVGTGREVFQAVRGDPNCPIQPGTSCDYCGQGIMLVCYVASSDGKRFKVGFDCAAKLNSAVNKAHMFADETAKFMADVRRKRLAMERGKRATKAETIRAQLDAWLADEAVRAKLEAMPHPKGFLSRETGEPMTLLEWSEWMAENSGAAGRKKVADAIRKLV